MLHKGVHMGFKADSVKPKVHPMPIARFLKEDRTFHNPSSAWRYPSKLLCPCLPRQRCRPELSDNPLLSTWRGACFGEGIQRNPLAAERQLMLEWYPFHNSNLRQLIISLGTPEKITSWKRLTSLSQSSQKAYLSEDLLDNLHACRFRMSRALWSSYYHSATKNNSW